MIPFLILLAFVNGLPLKAVASELPSSCTSHGLTSGKTENASSSYLSVSAALPSSLGRVHTCRIAAPASPALLQVTARKTRETQGSLHVDVYEPERWRSVGRLTVLSSSRLPAQNYFCLPPSPLANLPHYVTFSGTPGLEFSAVAQVINITLRLNKTQNFTLNEDRNFIFMFTPTNSSDITDAQLDVTVTSDGKPMAYLVVSNYCDRVTKESRRINDHSKPSMTLSFLKQGRITLSRVSSPKLSAEHPLFVGVYMVNGGDKNVNIILQKSFDYDYTAPICFLFFVPLLGGVLIALWALLCFREPLTLLDEATEHDSASSILITGTSTAGSLWRRLCPCRDLEDSAGSAGELQPLIRTRRRKTPSSTHEIVSAMWEIVKHHWFGLSPKTFSYMTCIVGCVLMVGAFQFVYENWYIMISEGNRDRCFYDEFCYRASPRTDLPFNLMVSNLAYMIHAIILAVSLWVMEAELYVQAKKKAKQDLAGTPNPTLPPGRELLPQHLLVCRSLEAHLPQLAVPKCDLKSRHSLALQLYARAYKRKYNFSIGYAFAWALLFEGFFSLTYHLCPTKMTFQFDSAFMLVIAGLIILSLYNGFSVKKCAEEKRDSKPVDAAMFFLFVIAPLFTLNYLGSVYNADLKRLDTSITEAGTTSSGPSMAMWAKVIFLILIITWYILIYLWAGYKLFYSAIAGENNSSRCANVTKLTLFTLTVMSTCVLFPLFFHDNLSDMLLFSAITSSTLSVMGKVIIKAVQSVPEHWDCERVTFRVFQALYIVVFLVFMVTAVYVFQGKPTSDKTLRPADSRDLNQECVLLGFFGYHDVWHILSSFALLMGAFLVMFISE